MTVVRNRAEGDGKRAVDNISLQQSRTGIGWRTIVGIMLIGFKTEGINLPSFIMDRKGRS